MRIAGGIGGEHIVPHSLDVSPQLGETLLGGTVVASGPFSAIAYEAGSAKHAKVLGDAGLPDLCDSGELTDRVRAAAKTLEQRPAGRIGQRHHYHSIGHILYRHPRMDKSITDSWWGATAERLPNWF
jgi:hypothetical protein